MRYTQRTQLFLHGPLLPVLKETLPVLLPLQGPTLTPHVTRVRRSPPLPHTLPGTSLHLSTPRSMTFSAECGRMWTVTLGHRMGSLSMAREGQTEAEASLAFGGLPALVPRMSESARCSVHLGVHLRLPHGLGQVGESHRRQPSPGRQHVHSGACSLRGVLARPVAHSLSPSFHLDLLPDLMSFRSSYLPGMGRSI